MLRALRAEEDDTGVAVGKLPPMSGVPGQPVPYLAASNPERAWGSIIRARGRHCTAVPGHGGVEAGSRFDKDGSVWTSS